MSKPIVVILVASLALAAALPHEIIEDFEGDKPFPEWMTSVQNVKVSGECGSIGKRAVYFNGPENEPRFFETGPMDLRTASMVQFQVQIGGQCNPPEGNEQLVLSYAVGPVWTRVASWDVENSPEFQDKRPDQWTSIHVPLPPDAQQEHVRLRFDQSGAFAADSDAWILDQLFVGGVIGSPHGLPDDPPPPIPAAVVDFEEAGPRKHGLLFASNPAVEAHEDEHCPIIADAPSGDNVVVLRPTPDLETTFLVTRDFDLPVHSLVQAYVAACGPEDETLVVNIDVSYDQGRHWKPVRKLGATEVRGWSRIFAALPPDEDADGPRHNVRVRFSTPPGGFAYAVDRIFIGESSGCFQRGLPMVDGSCECDKDWDGEKCEIPPKPLPKELHDTFDGPEKTRAKTWQVLQNAVPRDDCGAVEGKSLVFDSKMADAVRRAVTQPIDTSSVFSIEFDVSLSTCNVPEPEENLVVSYSTDGGIHWHPFTTIGSPGMRNFKYVWWHVELPQEARAPHTVFEFAMHKFQEDSDNWYIDNLYVGGDLELPALPDMATTSFHDPKEVHHSMLWTMHGHIGNGTAPHDLECVIPHVGMNAMYFNGPPKEERDLQTYDLDARNNPIVEFMLASCMGPRTPSDASVLVQVTTGFQKWRTVATITSDTVPTGMSWHRMHYPLDVDSGRYRVRVWSETMAFAIDHFYVGEGCPGHCHGHGVCGADNQCACMSGFTPEDDCGKMKDAPRTFKDEFDGPGDELKPFWSPRSSVIKDVNCGSYTGKRNMAIGEGGNPDDRFVMTAPMDLSHTRSIEFFVLPGGTCSRPGRGNSFVIEASPNSGVDWHEVATIDVADWDRHEQWKYLNIELPAAARAPESSVNLRFRQPTFTSSRDYWLIDSLYIGDEVGPAAVKHIAPLDFEDPKKAEDAFIRHPRGHFDDSCGAHSGEKALAVTPDGPLPSFAETVTMDLTAAKGPNPESALMQFFVTSCEGSGPRGRIHIEFSTDFGYEWHPVRVLHTVLLPEFRRVSQIIPEEALTPHTRFRFRSEGNAHFAIDDLSIEVSTCPGDHRCFGHGQCMPTGECHCDDGFDGPACARPSNNSGTGVCAEKMDMFLVIDGSASIEPHNFDKVRAWAGEVVDELDVSPEGARVGIIQFSADNEARLEVNLDANVLALKDRITTIEYMNGIGTDIQGGLMLAREHLEHSRKDPGREHVPKHIVLFTDGEPSVGFGDPHAEAELIKQHGIEIFSVGVGKDISMDTLHSFASHPVDRHVFHVENFDLLSEITTELDTQLCVTCFGAIDVMLVIDSSGSVKVPDFDNVRKFARHVVGAFEIGDEGGAHAGLVRFSDEADLIVPLDGDLFYLDEKIQAMPKVEGDTYIGKGLLLAGEQLLQGGRQDVPNVIIVVTDGLASDAPVPIADRLRSEGIEIITVGVGHEIDERQLGDMADGPEHTFRVEDFEHLSGVVSRLVRQTCTDGVLPPTPLSAVASVGPADRTRKNTAAQRAQQGDESGSGESWLGAGVAVGGVALVGLVVAAVAVRRRRTARKEEESGAEMYQRL